MYGTSSETVRQQEGHPAVKMAYKNPSSAIHKGSTFWRPLWNPGSSRWENRPTVEQKPLYVVTQPS